MFQYETMGNETIRTDRRVTLKSIAEELDLSPSTVSDILNHKPNCFASKATKERVFEATRALGYRPNIVARNLRKQKTNIIGLIAPNLKVDVVLREIEMIESLAWAQNYHLLIGYSCVDSKKEESLLEDFYNRQVDGIILFPTSLPSQNAFLKELVSSKFPLIVIGEVEGVETDFITTDYRKGGYVATEHLAKLGYDEIGFFSGSLSFSSGSRRFAGYEEALKDNGLQFREEWLFSNVQTWDFSEIVRAADRILEKGAYPKAFVASNDGYAVGLIQSALKKGLKIPEDISVVGFDDSEIAKASPVPLTTVKQPREEISRTAFCSMLEKIEKKKEGPVRIFVEPELIIRESTREIKR